MMGRACSRREERPEFSNSVPFCTISFHFGASAAGEGGLEDSGLERREERHGIFEFCTILYHFVPFWVPFRSILGRRQQGGRVGGFGAGAAFGHDTSRASVAGLDWVRRYGRDLTCIHDKGSLGGWARGKCQWWGRDYPPPLNLPLRKGERSSLVQTGETGNRLSMNIGNTFLQGGKEMAAGTRE